MFGKRAKSEIIRVGGNGRRSKCVVHNGVLYISGITSSDLSADMAGQTKDILDQADKLMSLHGTNRNRLLSVSAFLHDMAEYGDFNGVWDEWVSDGHEPVRTTVGAQLALPEYKVKVSFIVAL